MDYYIDIKILAAPEFNANVLLSAVFAKLHKALVETGNGEIGVSFPEVSKLLGAKLRLHGNFAALNKLMADNWLIGFADYAQVSDILPVPAIRKYRQVKRVQAKSNIDRLLRRAVKRGLSPAEAEERRKNIKAEDNLKQPFLRIKSQSTGQSFRLFIEHGPIIEEHKPGAFSAYGLSYSATVPWF